MKTNKTVLSLIAGIMVLSLILVPTGDIRAESTATASQPHLLTARHLQVLSRPLAWQDLP